MSEPSKPLEPTRRAPMGRGRGYFFTWLLSWFAIFALSLFDFTKKAAAGEAHAKELGGYLIFAAFVALLALPALFLLRVVPESSKSSGVRLVRRALFGILCGLLLGALLSACIAAGGKADPGTEQMLAPLGALFGFIAGLVDSIALDDHANLRPGAGDDDGDSGPNGATG